MNGAVQQEDALLKQRIVSALGRRKIETAAFVSIAALSSIGIAHRDTPVNPASPTVVQNTHFLTTATANALATSAATPVASGAEKVGLPDIDHARVTSWIKRFTTDQRRSFATYLDRMTKYEPMIAEKLEKRDMPQGLIYLAMIESGFNPTAKSRVAATGLWQFMRPTAREYGLKVSGRTDERKNAARSTDAALEYLADLHDRFGSWYLAAAAYNTGQGRVARIMKQVTGREKGTDADFYRIASRLPKETREYVPKLVAAARIGAEPEKYGFGSN
jgi:membrane-bound lytic murein transglycosylase D